MAYNSNKRVKEWMEKVQPQNLEKLEQHKVVKTKQGLSSKFVYVDDASHSSKCSENLEINQARQEQRQKENKLLDILQFGGTQCDKKPELHQHRDRYKKKEISGKEFHLFKKNHNKVGSLDGMFQSKDNLISVQKRILRPSYGNAQSSNIN